MTVLPYDTPIDKHLRPGEQLRWVGRARRGWRYRWNNRILIVQIVAAFVLLVWLARVINWGVSALAPGAGLSLSAPSLRLTVLVLLFGGVTAWQFIAERRRRAGTWYAVTDRRVLFVMTNSRPESVIGIEWSELARISLNNGAWAPAPLDAVILQLKHIDPYLCASGVLGYQPGNKIIVLEDVEDPHEFHRQLVARGRLADKHEPSNP